MQRNTLHDISVHIIAATCLLVVGTAGYIVGNATRTMDAEPALPVSTYRPVIGGPGPEVSGTTAPEIIFLPPGIDVDLEDTRTTN